MLVTAPGAEPADEAGDHREAAEAEHARRPAGRGLAEAEREQAFETELKKQQQS